MFILILWCVLIMNKALVSLLVEHPNVVPEPRVPLLQHWRETVHPHQEFHTVAGLLNLTNKRLFLLQLTRQITLRSHSGIIITHNFPVPLMIVGRRAETVESCFIHRAVTNLIACRVDA